MIKEIVIIYKGLSGDLDELIYEALEEKGFRVNREEYDIEKEERYISFDVPFELHGVGSRSPRMW